MGIQRKTYPDDLIASLDDGRLARELPLLARTEYPLLIAEGEPMWTADGHLMQSWSSRWTKQQLRNLLRSVWRVHGVMVERTTDINDTVSAVLELEEWFKKDTHQSLLTRHKHNKDSWGLANNREMARFLLQGFPGVGGTLACEIFDTFSCIPLQWSISKEELMEVPGIGVKRAQALWKVLNP